MASTRPTARNVRSRSEIRECATHPTGSHDTRGNGFVASPGDNILLQTFFMEFAAQLLPARDLARVCALSSQHRGHAAALANAALDAQHGLALRENATLADMHIFDGVPDAASIDLREYGTRRVRKGNPLSTTYVGSYKDKVTLAQLPPAAGDTWSIDLTLRCGVYQLALDGWANPAHGILHLWLNGRLVGEMNWLHKRTRERCHSVTVVVPWTGAHQLTARCERSSADMDRPTRHWVCLKRLRMQRLGPLS